MPNTSTVRIWSHLRQIGSLSGDVNGDAWFSVNLAPIFVADGGAATAVDVKLATQYLQPWTWQWTQSRLRMALLRGGAVIGAIDVPAAQIFTEASTQAIVDVFVDEFSSNTKTFDGNSFGEAVSGLTHNKSVSEDDSARDWRTYLLHASTYPGDIPLRAGIAAFFKVPYSQLSNADEVVVAPVFANAPFSGPMAPVDPPRLVRLNPDLTTYTPGGKAWVTQWSYVAPSGTDLNAQLVQTQTPLRIPGAAVGLPWNGVPWGNDGFIDEQTLWITPAASAWQQGVNWHEQLEQRLAGLFDLPQRLLEWADQALTPDPPGGIDAAFGQALLATMRDLMRTCGDPANSEDLRRPDRSTLADDIANVILPGVANIAAREQMVKAVRKYYAGSDNYTDWQANLTKVLTASKRFTADELNGAWENPFETTTTLPDGTAVIMYTEWLKRMHRVRAWLFDPENLRAFIEADWLAAFSDQTLPQALRDAFNKGFPNVDPYLQSIDLISVFQQGFMGVAWRGQTSSDWYSTTDFTDTSGKTTTKIAASMTAALIDAYRDRLGLPDPPVAQGGQVRTVSAYSKLLPRQDGVSSVQRPDIEKYIANFIDTWNTSRTGPAPAAGKTPDYSRGNQGINIQLTNLDVQGGDDQAFLGNFRGAAVFMRLSGNNAQGKPHPWGLLNLGQYSLRDDGTLPEQQVAPPLNLDQVVVAPSQIVYRNGLRQVTFTYRNQPLSARSPAAALSQTRSMKGYDEGDFRQGVFQLWNPFRGASPFRLPRIVFGSSYDVASTAIGLGGEMAKEVCDPAKPWRVASDPTTWNVPAGSIHTTDACLRTMPVGLVRVEGQQARGASSPISKLSGPPIPDMVYPIVRSGIPIEEQQDTVILLVDTGNLAGAMVPATWIQGAATKMDFYIRPPATDVATFDCWPFDTAPSLADRAHIYSLIAQNTDIFDDGDSSAAPDLTLDDPSVNGFTITLLQLSFPGAPMTVDTKTAPVCRAAATSTLLQQYQSTHLPVTVQVGATAGVVAPAKCTDAQQVTVTVAPGAVFQLDITPVVGHPEHFDTDVLQLAPRTFYIEVASGLNVTSLDDAAKALNESLLLKLNTPPFDDAKNPDQMQVSLDLEALAKATSAKNLAPQIHRVELMVQRWRWQGRPPVREDADHNLTLFDFPYSEIKAAGGSAAAADSVMTPLDGVYFGERDTNDQLTVPAQVDAVRDAVAAATGKEAVTPPVLYTYDLSHSPQAPYYRFAVRVFSRYEGLLSSGSSVESRIIRAMTAGDTTPEQWRRLLPLCRRTQQAPKPAVRLIIPLTRTGKDEQTPGLLVVIDEAWHEWAGLAERLEVQIASVQDPATGGEYLQAGPDPVIQNPDYTSGPKPLNLEPNPAPYGPIGFTFDTNTDAALFSTTSFILHAPRQVNPDGLLTAVELSWYFLQLQFQRSIDRDGTLNYTSDMESGWTAPLQTQVLPASNLWNITAKGVADRIDVSTLQGNSSQNPGITLTNPGGDEVMVNPLPPDANVTRNRFEVWAVLTRSLNDVFGRAGQEAFVTMVPFAELATVAASPATSLRLVEVQAMATLSPANWNDWHALAADMFPIEGSSGAVTDPTMARARIVRVSPPIMIVPV